MGFRKFIASFCLFALVAFGSVAISPTPADAYWTGSWAQAANYNPTFYFTKGTNTNSTFTGYMSYYNTRYYMSMQAGSGITGVTNDCTTNQGWLPSGTYSNVEYMYKTWGVAVVQGAVWYIGDKLCSAGTTWRTELFIHSSGIEGTAWNGNYQSNGCIKVSQSDRAAFVSWFRVYAFNKDSETLYVQ